MKIIKLLINNNENKKYIFNYYSDIILRVFTLFWIAAVIFSYIENNQRPESLFEPIIWIQKWFITTQPSTTVFYTITILASFLSVITIFKKKIFCRSVLFILLLWLNAVKWNYNFFSHVGYLFLLTHFFTIFIPPKKISGFKNDNNEITLFSHAIRWSCAGILITYTMSGVWKFLGLLYKIVFQPEAINWLSKDAVELNAIVSARLWDESISETMMAIYEIPIIWQIATITIFLFQLVAVLGAFNKKISYFILISLVIFHIYNMLFINTFFYVSTAVLVIILFPYHLVLKKTYNLYD